MKTIDEVRNIDIKKCFIFDMLLLKFLKLKIIATRKKKENNIEFESPPRYKDAGSIATKGKYQNI